MILVNFQIYYHKTTDSIYRKCNDTNEVFRSRNPKKDRQYNGQKRTKRTNNKDKREKELSTNTTLNNSPVYIRQKRRDLEQIATEGFLGSS